MQELPVGEVREDSHGEGEEEYAWTLYVPGACIPPPPEGHAVGGAYEMAPQFEWNMG